MPWKQSTLEWLSTNGLFLGGAAMAALYSAAQSKKNTGRIDWLEAVMCALIAFGVSSALELIGIQRQFTWLISVFVGSVGSQYVRSKAIRQVDAKIDAVSSKVEALNPSKEIQDDSNASK